MGKKITLDDIEKWKELRSKGYSFKDIGTHFCTSPKTISKYLKETIDLRHENAPSIINSSPASSSNCKLNSLSLIENDPEILKLRKELEAAKLKRQIREQEAPLELESRIKVLEQKISTHRDWFSDIATWMNKIKDWRSRIDNTITVDLENYNCAQCGSQRRIALNVRCTECDHTAWWGYFSKE